MADYRDRLKDLMGKKGLDITALAAALNISYQAVRKVLVNNGSFGPTNNRKAAAFFEVDPVWLEGGDELLALVKHIEHEDDAWPFDLAGLTKDRYMALPTSSRGVVQAAMRSAIEAEEAQIAKQETPYKASRAA